MKKKLLLAFSLMGAALLSQAQTKIGGALGAADKDSYLQLGDANGANKGLLLPRVALTSTTSATPLNAFVDGMYVYNTANQNDVTPGLYYSENNHWVKVTTGTAVALNITGNGAPTSTTAPNPVKGMIYTDVDGGDPDAIPVVPASPTYGQQWTYDGTKWISYAAPASTEWYLAGQTSDAGGNKTSGIYRTGWVAIGKTSATKPLDVGGDALINGLNLGRGKGNDASNTAFGLSALSTNTNGNNNVAVGKASLSLNTTGYNNAAIGAGALSSNTSGYQNIAVGRNSLYANTTGSQNTAVGSFSLSTSATGIKNTAVGNNSASATTASFNTAVGANALAANSSGGANSVVGCDALSSATTANNNTSVGQQSLHLATTGSGNSAFGVSALAINKVGSNNTAIGLNAASQLDGGDNNIAIGNGAQLPNVSGSHQLSIGNAIYGTGVTGSVGAGTIGIGTQTPAEKLEVNGAVKLGGSYNVTTVGQTSPVPAGGAGTICFSNGHFWGYTGSSTGWRQLDN